MKTRSWLWLGVLLLPAVEVFPQGGNDGAAAPGVPGQPAPPGSGDQNPEGDNMRALPQDGGPPQADSVPPMTLDDARLNFTTVVESFIAGLSPNGYWPLKEKGTARAWKLKLVSIDTKALREAGGQRYAAPAILRDIRDGQRLRVEFIVDFSGNQWKVAEMRLRPKKGGRRRR